MKRGSDRPDRWVLTFLCRGLVPNVSGLARLLCANSNPVAVSNRHGSRGVFRQSSEGVVDQSAALLSDALNWASGVGEVRPVQEAEFVLRLGNTPTFRCLGIGFDCLSWVGIQAEVSSLNTRSNASQPPLLSHAALPVELLTKYKSPRNNHASPEPDSAAS